MASRREFLAAAAALWQAAVLNAKQHRHEFTVAEIYRFQFLTGVQQESLRRLMALIVPADERSGGAAVAKVDEYVDFVLKHSDPQTQRAWQRGLQRYEKADVEFLEAQAAHEFDPQTEDQQFFVLLKNAITEGFYTSQEGIDKELGYQGMGFVLEFRGCGHAEHNTPQGWRPSLKQIAEA